MTLFQENGPISKERSLMKELDWKGGLRLKKNSSVQKKPSLTRKGAGGLNCKQSYVLNKYDKISYLKEIKKNIEELFLDVFQQGRAMFA